MPEWLCEELETQLESTLETDLPTNRHNNVALTRQIIILGDEDDALKGEKLDRFFNMCPDVVPVLKALARGTTIRRVQINLYPRSRSSSPRGTKKEPGHAYHSDRLLLDELTALLNLGTSIDSQWRTGPHIHAPVALQRGDLLVWGQEADSAHRHGVAYGAASGAFRASLALTLGSKDCIVKAPLVDDKRVMLQEPQPPAQRPARIRGSAKPWWVVQG